MRTNSLLLTSRDVGTEEIKVNEDMIEPWENRSAHGNASFKVTKADKFKLDLQNF